MNKLSRLIEIDFIQVGAWKILENELNLTLIDDTNPKHALYAFILDQDVKYRGKTTNHFNKRMYGYKKPGPSQRTNLRVNNNIKTTLPKSSEVKVYMLPDNQILKYGSFNLSITEGLEHSIIKELQPSWNMMGNNSKKTSKQVGEESLHTVEELNLIENELEKSKDLIGSTSIKETNQIINRFMNTVNVYYYLNDEAIINALSKIKSLGYKFNLYQEKMGNPWEASINGSQLYTDIVAIGDTKEDTEFLVIRTFAKMFNEDQL